MKMLRVISKKDGFRRAGRAWTGVTEVPAGEFNKTQLAALMAEPKLVVQEFDAAPATSPAPPGIWGPGFGRRGRLQGGQGQAQGIAEGSPARYCPAP